MIIAVWMCSTPDVESPPQRQRQRGQAFGHAGHGISAVGIVPAKGLQDHMGAGEGYAEVLGVHYNKVTKELLHLCHATTAVRHSCCTCCTCGVQQQLSRIAVTFLHLWHATTAVRHSCCTCCNMSRKASTDSAEVLAVNLHNVGTAVLHFVQTTKAVKQTLRVCSNKPRYTLVSYALHGNSK